MIHITTDVAVVGSGTGGVSAAYHCATAGLNTTLFEAGKGFGPALTGVNGVFAVGTAYQKSKHINESKKDIFLRLMNHANWLIDARQVTEFLNRSAGIWQWLESLGCEAEAVLAYNMDAPHTWHYFNAAKPRLEVVGKAFLDAGGTLQDGAYMNELIMEDGRVVGIKGETENGEPIEVHCKAVVLATGEPQRIAKPGDGPSPGPAPRGDGPQKEKPYGIAMATRGGCSPAYQYLLCLQHECQTAGVRCTRREIPRPHRAVFPSASGVECQPKGSAVHHRGGHPRHGGRRFGNRHPARRYCLLYL